MGNLDKLHRVAELFRETAEKCGYSVECCNRREQYSDWHYIKRRFRSP